MTVSRDEVLGNENLSYKEIGEVNEICDTIDDQLKNSNGHMAKIAWNFENVPQDRVRHALAMRYIKKGWYVLFSARSGTFTTHYTVIVSAYPIFTRP